MTNLYKSQQLANQEIDALFEGYKKVNTIIFIPGIILNISSRFQVNEKFILKRLELLVKNEQGSAVIRGDFVEFK